MRQPRDHESQARAGVLLVRAGLCDFLFGGRPLLPVPDTVLLRRVLQRGALLPRVRVQSGHEQRSLVLKNEELWLTLLLIRRVGDLFQVLKSCIDNK